MKYFLKYKWMTYFIPPPKKSGITEDPPPILKSWRHIYWAVIINLIGWLSAFYLIRRIFE